MTKMTKMTAVTTVFPDTGLPRFPSENSDNELKQTMFHTGNARLLSESAGFALWTDASPVVGGVQGGHGEANLLLGAVPALCSSAPKENGDRTCAQGFERRTAGVKTGNPRVDIAFALPGPTDQSPAASVPLRRLLFCGQLRVEQNRIPAEVCMTHLCPAAITPVPLAEGSMPQ